MPARLQLIARTGHPDFLDLPWDEPLAEWESERLVEVVRGIHRHVVRFVEYESPSGPALYALKELPAPIARREYGLLRSLAAEEMPVVEAVGVVTERGEDLEAILITRHLDYSLPFRTLFARGSVPDLRRRLLDAGAELLVRLHLGGFFWGDCSLSNTLFRRDAGALAAYLVDAETGEMHPSLSDGQRAHDLMIAEDNVAGELADVEAELGREGELAPEETAAELVTRYESLWNELTREESFGDDTRYKIDDRLHRLNELGFDVDELELIAGDGGYRLRLNPRVVEPGHHRRRLHALTGLMAQENQARRMLNDLARYRAELDRKGGRPVPETVAVHRWLSEVFEPAVAAVPAELWGKRDAAEVFHEALEHRWFLSQQAGEDIGLMPAVKAYVDDVLRHAADERAVLEPGARPKTRMTRSTSRAAKQPLRDLRDEHPLVRMLIMRRLIQLDALQDDGGRRHVARVPVDHRDLVGDVLAARDLAEDGVLAVEPRRRVGGDDEELAAVRVRPGIRHRERAPLDLVVVELVLELVAGAAGSRPLGATALDHEVRDHAVEDEAVVEALAGKLGEVLDRLRRIVREELELDCSFAGVKGRFCHAGTVSKAATRRAAATRSGIVGCEKSQR